MKNQNAEFLELAKSLSIEIFDPFSEFLMGTPTESHFKITLLDCYHLAGHACLSMTGAFLSTQYAIHKLYPESNVCVRGDIRVSFGSKLDEMATGPRSNVISSITGAWGESGFPGLNGKFVRKGLMTFGNSNLPKNVVRFSRISTKTNLDVIYDPTTVLKNLKHGLPFPESWRIEVLHIIKNRDEIISSS